MNKQQKIDVLLEAFNAGAFVFNPSSKQVELDTQKVPDSVPAVNENNSPKPQNTQLLTAGTQVGNTYIISEGKTMANKNNGYTKRQMHLIGEVVGQLISEGRFKKDKVIEAAIEGNSSLSGRTFRFAYEHINDGKNDVVVELQPLREAEEKPMAEPKGGEDKLNIIVQFPEGSQLTKDDINLKVEKGGTPAKKVGEEEMPEAEEKMEGGEEELDLSKLFGEEGGEKPEAKKEGEKVEESAKRRATFDRKTQGVLSQQRSAIYQRQEAQRTTSDVLTEGVAAGEMGDLLKMWGRIVGR